MSTARSRPPAPVGRSVVPSHPTGTSANHASRFEARTATGAKVAIAARATSAGSLGGPSALV
eukprot:1790758-Alexandrium_andersonii.AAC.1